MKNPEILSPAGNFNSFLAAINAGADAVYLGLKEFSARKRAENFSMEELREAIRIAHNLNKKIYITVNTLIKSNEYKDVINLVNHLILEEVDGFIIQDLGLLDYLLTVKKENDLPNLSVQLSTQASLNSEEGINFFNDLGLDRVVIGRETSLEDINDYYKNTTNTVETKTFCHGALCFAYSGQCHLSSSIGKRSGNRGECAQPCRRRYQLSRNNKVLKDGYLMSTKELNTLDHIDDLKKSNVDSIKIEGRMRSPEYVYAATKAYSDALNGLEPNTDNLNATFSRDFTEGFLFDSKDNISSEKSKKQGILIGKTGKTKNQRLELILNDDVVLVNGDGISFGDSESSGTYINKIYSKNNKTLVEGTEQVFIKTNETIPEGINIFRTFDKSRIDNLKKLSLKKPELKKIPVDFGIFISKDNNVLINLTSGETFVSYESNIVPQIAQNRALNEEIIKEQFSKLGNTDFKLNNIDIYVDKDLFLSRKELNTLKKESLRKLETELISKPIIYNNIPEINSFQINPKVEQKEISIKVEDIRNLPKDKLIDTDEMVFEVNNKTDLDLLESLIAIYKNNGVRVLLSTPVIIDKKLSDYLKEIDLFNFALKNNIDGFLIPNYEFLNILKPHLDSNMIFEADLSVNIFNEYSIDFLKDLGFTNVVLSDELNKKEILDLSKLSVLPTTLNVYGNRLLMISKNCLFNCNSNCSTCVNEGVYDLVNDKNDRYIFKVNDNKSYIYNKDLTKNYDAYFNQPYINKVRLLLGNNNLQDLEDFINNLKQNITTLKNERLDNYLTGVN